MKSFDDKQHACKETREPILAKSTDDIISNIKPSRQKRVILQRSQSSILLRNRNYSSKILEKGESFGDNMDSEVDAEDQDSSESEENREKSIQKLRGILKRKMTAGSIVRSIKFSMENQDKIKSDLRHFEKKTKNKLRSPPPKEPSPCLMSKENRVQTKVLIHSASFYTFENSRNKPGKNIFSPDLGATTASDSENSNEDEAVLMPKRTKPRYANSRLDTDGYDSIHKGAYEYALDQAFDNIERDANEKVRIKGKGSRDGFEMI